MIFPTDLPKTQWSTGTCGSRGRNRPRPRAALQAPGWRPSPSWDLYGTDMWSQLGLWWLVNSFTVLESCGCQMKKWLTNMLMCWCVDVYWLGLLCTLFTWSKSPKRTDHWRNVCSEQHDFPSYGEFFWTNPAFSVWKIMMGCSHSGPAFHAGLVMRVGMGWRHPWSTIGIGTLTTCCVCLPRGLSIGP